MIAPSSSPIDELVGRSDGMVKLREQARVVAACDVGLLLEGESGTGKELLSRTVHGLRARATGPFVGANGGGHDRRYRRCECHGHAV